MTLLSDRPGSDSKPEHPTRHGSESSLNRVGRIAKDLVRRPRGDVSRRNAPPASTVERVIAWALITVSAVAIWSVFFALVLSSLQYRHNQANLYSQFRQELAEETATTGSQIEPDAPVALISMPSAGIHQQVVVEGTTSGDLELGPGHRRNSVLPGQAGTALIYGRDSMFGGPFKKISSARPGDAITVTTGQGKFTYMVERVRHAGDKVSAALNPGEGRLVLVTAEGSGWRSGWAPSKAVYVDAKLQGKAAGAPGGRPTAIPGAEAAMRGDIGALYTLVLWLPLLAIVGLVLVWAQDRWGRWQTWLVGTPMLVAAVWGATETAVQLLPNLV